MLPETGKRIERVETAASKAGDIWRRAWGNLENAESETADSGNWKRRVRHTRTRGFGKALIRTLNRKVL